MQLLGKPYEPCKSCGILKVQLELANAERERLVNSIINLIKPNEIKIEDKVLEPVKPKSIAWRERKRMLEEDSRSQAAAVRSLKEFSDKANKNSIENLEKELGIDEDAS